MPSITPQTTATMSNRRMDTVRCVHLPLHGAQGTATSDDSKVGAVKPPESAGESHHLHSPVPFVRNDREAPEDTHVVREVPLA